MKKYNKMIKYVTVLLVSFLVNIQLMSQDLGTSAYSTLRWDHFSIADAGGIGGNVIGLTTDKKMYVAGQNLGFIIHTNGDPNYQAQYTFRYVPSPTGQTVKKVDVINVAYDINNTYIGNVSSFGCLTESGKLYVWGFNTGLLENAFPISTLSTTDTTKVRRSPVQLTILGESDFVDFDMPQGQVGLNYWVAIGASGKAYAIGRLGTGGFLNPVGNSTTFFQLPNPIGVAITFKYTKVWVSENRNGMYLKGNDGNIYYAGPGTNGDNSTGVPSLFYYTDALGQLYNNSGTLVNTIPQYNFKLNPPVLVPFPAGEDIVSIDTRIPTNTLVLSASGKAYATGIWNERVLYNNNFNYYRFPLKNLPTLGTELFKQVVPSTGVPSDTTYMLKSFVEVAIPSGATKVVEFASISPRDRYHNFVIIGDNKKAYWSGTSNDQSTDNGFFSKVAYLDYTTTCRFNIYKTAFPYKWEVKAPELDNLSKMYAGFAGAYMTSESKIGYVAGEFIYGVDASGRTWGNTSGIRNNYLNPKPIANELLDFCNSNRGLGGTGTFGPVIPTNTAVGVLDCSKTQLIVAPMVGTASNLSLVVTVNVTTAGTFTPITVSGSGMSVASGYTISTTATGVQQFVIPIHYDGTALGVLNFTVGSAGTCSADLAGTSKKTVNMDVWTLDNCTLKLVAPKLK